MTCIAPTASFQRETNLTNEECSEHGMTVTLSTEQQADVCVNACPQGLGAYCCDDENQQIHKRYTTL